MEANTFVMTESTFDALDRLQKSLRDLIESLEVNRKAEAVQVPQPEPVKPVTLEEVRKVLVEKSRNGKTADVKGLLSYFHATSLPEVDPVDYADLLEMGRKL